MSVSLIRTLNNYDVQDMKPEEAAQGLPQRHRLPRLNTIGAIIAGAASPYAVFITLFFHDMIRTNCVSVSVLALEEFAE